jgi:hypothetical protein
MGALIDRFHAVRIAVWVSLALVPIPFLTYFLVVDYETSVRLEMFKVPLFAIISAAGMPLMISVFPKESFGQMCSANGLVKQGSMMVLAIVGAWFMDLVTRSTLLVENFRYAFLWVGAGFVLQFIIYVLLYREWKKLGGINYRAPGSTGDDQPAQRS